MLASLFATRLPGIIDRNPHAWQRTHACWEFNALNLNVGAAIKVALGQAKDLEDLKACDESSCLWTHDIGAFMAIEGDRKMLVGSYVAFFVRWARFFRSGKAYGADINFGIRINQHAKGSLLDNADSQKSNFYQQFPSSTSQHSTEGMRKGSFEDVTFFIGTAFKKEVVHNPNNVLVKDVSKGGIFRWTQAALELAKSIPHGGTLVEKQLHMVAFLLENFDDLMIEPKYNVSESSGWDPFMRGRGPGGSSGAESRRLFSQDMH